MPPCHPRQAVVVGAFEQTGKLKYFEPVKPIVVSEDMATLPYLAELFRDLAKKVRSRDAFVLFAAGHGVSKPHPVTRAPHYYLICHGDTHLPLDGFVSVRELIGDVTEHVPRITRETWGREQTRPMSSCFC